MQSPLADRICRKSLDSGCGYDNKVIERIQKSSLISSYCILALYSPDIKFIGLPITYL